MLKTGILPGCFSPYIFDGDTPHPIPMVMCNFSWAEKLSWDDDLAHTSDGTQKLGFLVKTTHFVTRSGLGKDVSGGTSEALGRASL